MKLFWLIIVSLLYVPACAAQTRLPREMPEKLSVAYRQSGGMSRSYRRVTIENGRLVFEELKGNRQSPEKWSAAVSHAELAALYRVFVENEFDTIENDERKGIVYDAGSENISVSTGAGRSVQVTYGKNSPLSGRRLARYAAVRRALEELVARVAEARSRSKRSSVKPSSLETLR